MRNIDRKASDLRDLALRLLESGAKISEGQSEEIFELARLVLSAKKLSVVEEFEAIVGETMQPNARPVIAARLGIGHDRPLSLHDAGKLVGISKERARQLMEQFTSSLRGNAPGQARAWTPVLDNAISAISGSLPRLASSADRELHQENILADGTGIASLLAMAKAYNKEAQISLDYEGLVLSQIGNEIRSSQIIRTARKHCEHWGVANLSDIAEQVNLSVDSANALELVRGVLETEDEVVWLEGDRWVYFMGTVMSGRNKLANEVEKVMSVTGSLDVAELRNGICRHHRMTHLRPPTNVLLAFCASLPEYEIADSRVVGVEGRLRDWRDVLGSVDKALVTTLMDNGYVMARDDLLRVASEEHKANRNSLVVHLTYSCVLDKPARGVWALRGAPVAAAQIAALERPIVRTEVFQEQGWTRTGSPWLVYRLSSNSVESGVVSIPKGVLDGIEGRFELEDQSGERASTLVLSAQRMWGLAPYFARVNPEPGDYLLLEFNLDSQVAVGRLGGRELIYIN